MNQLKLFTISEANQLLPKLTAFILELQKKRQSIMSMEAEIDALEIISDKKEDGISPSLNVKVEEYSRVVNRFYRIIDELHETGCFLKDVDSGLIDFYTLHHGHVVYLCWKLNEPEVGFWHEIGRGFTCRQPLSVSPDEVKPVDPETL